MSITWLAKTVESDRVAFRIGRDGERLIAEWVGLAKLVAVRGAADVSVEVAPDADADVVAKLRAGMMQALIRHQNGKLTLHASAVSWSGEAIAFAGDPGAGKSTLAFALASSADHSFALLSDDCLPVDEGELAVPSETVGWLDGRALAALALAPTAGKAAVRPTRVAQKPARLRKIVHLAFGDDFGVRRLRGREAAAVLGRAMIRFVLDDPDVNRRDMDRLAELASSVEIFELVRPRSLERLRESVSILVKEVALR